MGKSDYIGQYQRELEIYEYYLGHRVRPGMHRNSPFRPESDSHSFSLYVNRKNGSLYFKDHVSEIYGDAVDFVKHLMNVSYRQALDAIKRDLGADCALGNGASNGKEHVQRRQRADTPSCNVIITHQKRDFNKHDLDWWDRFLIDALTLARYRVCAAQWYTVHAESYVHRIMESASDPIYVIEMPSARQKFYRPLTLERKRKWRSTTTADDIFGLDLLEDNPPAIFLLGGNKDVMAFSQLMGENLGICLNSESANLWPDLYSLLASKTRDILIMYDADEQGRKKTAAIISQYPGIRDASLPILAAQGRSGKIKDLSNVIEHYRHNPVALQKLKQVFSGYLGRRTSQPIILNP